jgi:PPOX class probable F420-dependent enzyme
VIDCSPRSPIREMPRPPLPPDIDEFLRRPQPAVVASVRADGSPHTVATWYVWDGESVLLSMDESRLRLRFMRRNPRISLTALDGDGRDRHVSLSGRIASIGEDKDLRDIDRLALHYTGAPFRTRDRRRFSARVEIDSWHAWDGARPWDPRSKQPATG